MVKGIYAVYFVAAAALVLTVIQPLLETKEECQKEVEKMTARQPNDLRVCDAHVAQAKAISSIVRP